MCSTRSHAVFATIVLDMHPVVLLFIVFEPVAGKTDVLECLSDMGYLDARSDRSFPN